MQYKVVFNLFLFSALVLGASPLFALSPQEATESQKGSCTATTANGCSCSSYKANGCIASDTGSAVVCAQPGWNVSIQCQDQEDGSCDCFCVGWGC